MDEKLRTQILSSINRGEPILKTLEILKSFKQEGGTKQEALRTLEEMRTLKDEDFEDQILELMDFVVGFCRPELRIW